MFIEAKAEYVDEYGWRSLWDRNGRYDRVDCNRL